MKKCECRTPLASAKLKFKFTTISMFPRVTILPQEDYDCRVILHRSLNNYRRIIKASNIQQWTQNTLIYRNRIQNLERSIYDNYILYGYWRATLNLSAKQDKYKTIQIPNTSSYLTYSTYLTIQNCHKL